MSQQLNVQQKITLTKRAAAIILASLESRWLDRKLTSFQANSLNFLSDMTNITKLLTENQAAYLLKLYDIASEQGPIGFRKDGIEYKLERSHIEILT